MHFGENFLSAMKLQSLSIEEKAYIVGMQEVGFSIAQIGREFGIAYQIAFDLMKRY